MTDIDHPDHPMTRRRFFLSLAAAAAATGVLPTGFPREAVEPDQTRIVAVNIKNYEFQMFYVVRRIESGPEEIIDVF